MLDTTAIRFRLLRSYRLGTANDSQALNAACQDVAALCAEVDRLARMYESDCPRLQPYNAVGVPQESIREAQRWREID